MYFVGEFAHATNATSSRKSKYEISKYSDSIQYMYEGTDPWEFCNRLQQYIEPRNFSEVHFFGDKVGKGGNDYEIFEDPRTIGHRVEGPHDTLAILKKVFGIEI